MTSVNPNDLIVENNKAAKQFEIRTGDGLARLRYEMEGSKILLIHTEVPKELEGRGIAGRLATSAMTYARDNGLKVVPLCPYVAAWLPRHAEFADLVAQEG
jgi:predicted GNAT family acetyltransferase